MSDNLAEDNVNILLDVFTTVQQRFRMNEDIVTEANGEITDILHDIELSNPKNAREGYSCYKALREARIRRRQAKEENEVLRGLYDFLQTQDKLFRSKLTQIKGDARKIVALQQNRVYGPRVVDTPAIPSKSQKCASECPRQ